MYLNFPSNPIAATVPTGSSQKRSMGRTNEAWVLHDFAYGDLVFDGRRPQSFLASTARVDVGVELFSMSKTYGMAGWRLGFALGNAELVRRIELLQDHAFAGIFRPVQEAGIAALTGPTDSVEQRRAAYEQRRDRALAPSRARGSVRRDVLRLAPAARRDHVDDLLDEHRVAVAPGEGFGDLGKGFARLSLAVGDDVLDQGLQRIRAALA